MKLLPGLGWVFPIAAVLSTWLLSPAALALNESQKIKANDTASSDNFGISVGISGAMAIVGSWNDDDTAENSGSAYLFRNPGSGTWSQHQKLHASDAAMGDNFGASVSISGSVAVVGAPFDDGRGSVYVFRDNGAATWTQVDKLFANDGAVDDSFGFSVAISGNTAVVGAMMGSGNAGSAYVFRDNGAGDWQQIAKLAANDGLPTDQFGNAVAISGNTVLVGSHLDSNAKGVAAGAVYVFQDNGGGTWSQVDKLTASDGSFFQQFGSAVAFNANTAVIGAIGDGTSGSMSGVTYVFERDGKLAWHQVDRLNASDAGVNNQFGYSVALSGNTAVVGANRADNTAGAAYLFRDNGLGNWNQVAKLRASDAASGDALGNAVGLSGTTALVGASLANGPTDSGSAYFYSTVTGLAGDYNGNGRVDAADYVLWRNSLGAVGSSLAADGNGDGVVNQADYQLWRENFGLSSLFIAGGSTASVPEPATLALLCLASGFLVFRRKKTARPPSGARRLETD